MKTESFVVYTKGGVNNGLGHLYRSLTFCKSISLYCNVYLVAIIEPGLENLFREINFKHKLCYSDEELLLENQFNQSSVTIFDMIFLNEEVYHILVQNSKLTVSISPIFNFNHEVDLLFTRNITENTNVKVYSGLKYSIFNDICERITDEYFIENLENHELTIGVSMGGVDAPNKTLRVLKALSSLKLKCTVWVIIGEGYNYSYNDLIESMNNDFNHEIILAKSNRSMWKILSKCHLAILAGGLTTIEAAYVGLPSFNIVENETHLSLLPNNLSSNNLGENFGVINDENLEKLVDKIYSIFTLNKYYLLEMRSKIKDLDKSGPYRIYETILKHLS